MYYTPIIYNVSMASHLTVYRQALPDNTRKLIIRERTGTKAVKIAYEATMTTYLTLDAGSAKEIADIYLEGITIYLQSPNDTVVVEMEVWTD